MSSSIAAEPNALLALGYTCEVIAVEVASLTKRLQLVQVDQWSGPAAASFAALRKQLTHLAHEHERALRDAADALSTHAEAVARLRRQREMAQTYVELAESRRRDALAGADGQVDPAAVAAAAADLVDALGDAERVERALEADAARAASWLDQIGRRVQVLGSPAGGNAVVETEAGAARVLTSAISAFAEALRAQPGAAALTAHEAAALGRRAAEVVGAGLEWYEHVGEVVDVHRAQAVLRVGSRQAVYDLVKRNRLLGLRRSGGAMAIPLFQVDPATGRPYRAVPPVLAAFAGAGVDPYSVASWFNTPQIELDGATPAAALRDPARAAALQTCAERAAARWAR